jgi:hypothetical protein
MAGLELVSFHLAGYPLAVQAAQVGQMQALNEQAQANRQRLCQLLGLTDATKENPGLPQQALLLRTGLDALACALDGPVELFHAEPSQLLPLPPLMQACQRLPAVRGLLRHQHRLWLLLDLNRLDLEAPSRIGQAAPAVKPQ